MVKKYTQKIIQLRIKKDDLFLFHFSSYETKKSYGPGVTVCLPKMLFLIC